MIVITTPTGQIGRQVLDIVLGDVLDGGESVRVIARDPSRLSPEVRERVEVVVGSHGDPDVVDAAFAGADSVFWLAPPNPRAARVEDVYVDFSRPACDAFKRRGFSGSWGSRPWGAGCPAMLGWCRRPWRWTT